MPCTHVIPNGAQRREESKVLSLLDLARHGLQIPQILFDAAPGMTLPVNAGWWKANSVNELLNIYNSRKSGNQG